MNKRGPILGGIVSFVLLASLIFVGPSAAASGGDLPDFGDLGKLMAPPGLATGAPDAAANDNGGAVNVGGNNAGNGGNNANNGNNNDANNVGGNNAGNGGSSPQNSPPPQTRAEPVQAQCPAGYSVDGDSCRAWWAVDGWGGGGNGFTVSPGRAWADPCVDASGADGWVSEWKTRLSVMCTHQDGRRMSLSHVRQAYSPAIEIRCYTFSGSPIGRDERGDYSGSGQDCRFIEIPR